MLLNDKDKHLCSLVYESKEWYEKNILNKLPMFTKFKIKTLQSPSCLTCCSDTYQSQTKVCHTQDYSVYSASFDFVEGMLRIDYCGGNVMLFMKCKKVVKFNKVTLTHISYKYYLNTLITKNCTRITPSQ